MEREGKLNAAIVGYGFAGKQHKEALRQDLRVNRIAVLDIDWEKRAQAQAEGLDVYHNLNELLDSKPDIVITALPPAKNLDVVKVITGHDPRPRAILIEKPLAIDLRDAEAIERSLSSSDVSSMIALTGHGFHPEFKKAHELIQSGMLGEIHTFLEQIHLGGAGLPESYLSRAYGGVVLENGIHTLDHLIYLTNRDDWQVEVAKTGNNHWRKEMPDWGEATLVNNQQVAHASWLWPKDFEVGLEGYNTTIVGTKGRLTILGFDGIKLETSEGMVEEHFHSPESTLDARHLPGFIAELKAFLDSIDRGTNFPIPVSYVVKLQKLLQEIERKASEGA